MPSSQPVLTTPLTRLFKIRHPVMLAGMNVAAGPKLAAAVTNAGGIGVIGGVRQSPKFLQGSILELKSYLEDKNAPFGVDLLIPQVGGSARKTNITRVVSCQSLLMLSSEMELLYSSALSVFLQNGPLTSFMLLVSLL